jgi:hypothetical protein
MGVNGGDRFAVPMDWVGLRPSQVEQLKKVNGIESVSELTDLDKRRLDDHLLSESHRWTNFAGRPSPHGRGGRHARFRYKVELEALNWLGMDYCSEWVSRYFRPSRPGRGG